VTQVAVQGLAPKQLQGVPSGLPVQALTHVAAASAGVGATTDATAGRRMAAPMPTRRTTSRRDQPAVAD